MSKSKMAYQDVQRLLGLWFVPHLGRNGRTFKADYKDDNGNLLTTIYLPDDLELYYVHNGAKKLLEYISNYVAQCQLEIAAYSNSMLWC